MPSISGLLVGLIGAGMDKVVKEKDVQSFNGATTTPTDTDIIEFSSKDPFSSATTYRLWVLTIQPNNQLHMDGRIHSPQPGVTTFCNRHAREKSTEYNLIKRGLRGVWQEFPPTSHPASIGFAKMSPAIMFALHHFQKDTKLKNIVIGRADGAVKVLYWRDGDEFVLEEPGFLEKATYGDNVIFKDYDYSVKPSINVYHLKVRLTNGKAMDALLEALKKR
ncbi:hypothetical protein MMC11_009156 [Xylographa trunciseda]|nr:hypothetical protein [Xylographa trunciseda]